MHTVRTTLYEFIGRADPHIDRPADVGWYAIPWLIVMAHCTHALRLVRLLLATRRIRLTRTL
jgi:hypothetical protein